MYTFGTTRTTTLYFVRNLKTLKHAPKSFLGLTFQKGTLKSPGACWHRARCDISVEDPQMCKRTTHRIVFKCLTLFSFQRSIITFPFFRLNIVLLSETFWSNTNLAVFFRNWRFSQKCGCTAAVYTFYCELATRCCPLYLLIWTKLAFVKIKKILPFIDYLINHWFLTY